MDAQRGQHPLGDVRIAGRQRRQLDQVGAVRERLLPGRLGGQPGLADAARPDQRDQPLPRDQDPQLGERLGPPDQLVQPGREAVADDGGLRRRTQPGVLGEDPAVQVGELRPGIQPQLVGEPLAQVGVAVQGLGLAAGRVQRAQVQHPQALPQRVRRDQLAELGGDQIVLPAGQPGVGEPFLHGEALPAEPVRFGPDELLVGHVRVGVAPPERQRRGQPVGVGRDGQAGETVRVHRRGTQQVTGGARLDQVPGARLGVVERLAQLGDPYLQGAERVRRRVLAPQVVDQPVRRHHPVAVGQQGGQQHPNLGTGHDDRLAGVGGDRERPEDAELHGAHPTSGKTTASEP